MKNTIVKFSEWRLIIEDVVAVSNIFRGDYDKNYFTVIIRGGEKMLINIIATDEEKQNYKGGTVLKYFEERAKREYDDFIMKWENCNN